MPQITSFQISLQTATWIDVNSQFTLNTLPDRVPDVLAVSNSLYNLMNCAIGARSRIFQPEYGVTLYQFLQEPLDQTTANAIQISFLQAIARWEPRITVDMGNSFVSPNSSYPGYDVRIAFSLNLNAKQASVSFALQQTSTS
jgi:phage baseplate assembly protein W